MRASPNSLTREEPTIQLFGLLTIDFCGKWEVKEALFLSSIGS
jgi:hypothetical protein